MGDPKKQHKKYLTPKRLFDKNRIAEEDKLLKEYGLKSKRELWKVDFQIGKLRRQAKALIGKEDEQKKFLGNLRKKGLKVESIDDVLSLKKEDILQRRLQTVLIKQGSARTMRHARQLIAHKHVAVGGRVINSPSYPVPAELESQIMIIKTMKTKKPKQEAIE